MLHRVQPAPALIAAVAGTICFVALSDTGRNARLAVPLSEHFDRLILAAGFGIEQVSVTGHRFTPDGAIYDALDLANVRSMLRFDGAAVRERMERLPWIASATITRVFPDRLEVRVKERVPFALWQRGEREYLVDGTGRVLSPVTAGSVTHLPRIMGEGAAPEAYALLSALQRFPAVAGSLEAAERIAERRWSLRLAGGTVVHLPAEGWEAALQHLAEPALAVRLQEAGARSIDLRVPERASVRKLEVSPAGASRRGS